ncbi:MAG: hypothetical protein JNK05_34335 [Myxococcales bacterium]|nr:hypothetical protein [Myxococcales bacterium]
MLLDNLTPAQARAAIGAMRAVADASPGLHPDERSMLAVTARTLGLDEDPLTILAITPDELAELVAEPRDRLRIIQCMLLMSLMDGSADREESELIRRFAATLGVHDERVESLRQLAEGRLTRLWLGLAWKSYGHEEFIKALRDEGPRGVWKIVGPMMGAATDWGLARKFISYGELEEGTLGREYFNWVRSHRFPFPGEPGGVPERGVWHDLTHVLGGYGTDPDGEVQVVSFIAGYRREDPFFWLFSIALQFHLGLRVSPYSPGGHTGHFQPAMVQRAYARGQRVKRDLSEAWDWAPEMHRPIALVREDLGIGE